MELEFDQAFLAWGPALDHFILCLQLLPLHKTALQKLWPGLPWPSKVYRRIFSRASKDPDFGVSLKLLGPHGEWPGFTTDLSMHYTPLALSLSLGRPRLSLFKPFVLAAPCTWNAVSTAAFSPYSCPSLNIAASEKASMTIQCPSLTPIPQPVSCLYSSQHSRLQEVSFSPPSQSLS